MLPSLTECYPECGSQCLNGAALLASRAASYGSSEFSQAEHDTLDTLRQAGVIFVAAAGNGAWCNRSTSRSERQRAAAQGRRNTHQPTLSAPRTLLTPLPARPTADATDLDRLGEQNRTYPASYNLANVVSVAASDKSGDLTWWSNRGRYSRGAEQVTCVLLVLLLLPLMHPDVPCAEPLWPSPRQATRSSPPTTTAATSRSAGRP